MPHEEAQSCTPEGSTALGFFVGQGEIKIFLQGYDSQALLPLTHLNVSIW